MTMGPTPATATVATPAAAAEAGQYEVVPGAAEQDRVVATEVWQRCGFDAITPEQQLRRYDWFYLQNPQGQGQINFLRNSRDPRPVGFLGVGARDWTVSGRPVKGGILVDFVVHPEHRLAAPALTLQRKGRERASQAAMVLTGLPDTKAVAVFKRLGAQFKCELHRYVRIVRHSAYLRRHLPGPLAVAAGAVLDAADALATSIRLVGSKCEGAWVQDFDQRFDTHWAVIDKSRRCLGVRDGHFLAWRFAAQPGRSYRTFAVTRRAGGELQMYFVCELSGDALVVKDLLGRGDQSEYRHALLLVSRAARGLGAATVSIQVEGDETLARAMRYTQFVARDSRPFFAMVEGTVRDEVAGASWYITQADEDI